VQGVEINLYNQIYMHQHVYRSDDNLLHVSATSQVPSTGRPFRR